VIGRVGVTLDVVELDPVLVLVRQERSLGAGGNGAGDKHEQESGNRRRS
jgi:hypothetical protein